MEESMPHPPVVNQCPDCSQSIDVTTLAPFSKVVCPHCGSSVRVRTGMGKYQITGVLGAGGMSQVFRAMDMHLQREVALKILHQTLSQDSALTAMFEREAKLTASILHPNVVKVYTVGQDQGYFFIAMELVDATSLEEIIAQDGALSEEKVLSIAHDVTKGLKAAHEEDLIHRDIKPGNMLVTSDGTSKLVDFGLAVQQGGVDESEELWATPFYVPPEKLEGEMDTYLGDIYSLGATLYHALAGKPPFEANTSSLEELKVIKKNEVDLRSEAPEVTKPTLKLISTMMAHAASDRPQSYDEILDQVEDIEKKQFGIRRRRVLRKNGKAFSMMVVGIFSALAAVVAVIYIQVKKNEPAQQPGDIGIGGGERVISAGDNTNTERYLEGRELIAEGKFSRAEPIFDTLIRETTPSPTTRMWTHYFGGLSKLFLGKDEESRELFAHIQAVAPKIESGEDSEKAMLADRATIVLLELSEIMAQPLPVFEDEIAFQNDSIGLAGLVAVGLKNWQSGQFDSGMRLLNRFAEGSPPDGYEWITGLQKQVARFRADQSAIADAPNPSRSSEDALGAQREKLNTILSAVKTKGAVPDLIRNRIARIGEIELVIAKEKAKEEKRAQMLAAAKAAADPEMPETTGDPIEELTEEEEGERKNLLALLTGFDEVADTLLFSGAKAKLEAFHPASPAGQKWKVDLVHAFTQADAFITNLSSKLNSGTYEGVVRRRVGVPLDAKITRADTSVFIVDLGFGPNEVEIGAFAPEWLLEAALDVFPEPSAANISQWESVVFFAFATDQPEEAGRIFGKLEKVDADFDARWERLMVLRGKGE